MNKSNHSEAGDTSFKDGVLQMALILVSFILIMGTFIRASVFG